MKRLIFALLAFLAVFTYIRALPNAETEGNMQGIDTEEQAQSTFNGSYLAIPVEISR